jgi:hypothetical protein
METSLEPTVKNQGHPTPLQQEETTPPQAPIAPGEGPGREDDALVMKRKVIQIAASAGTLQYNTLYALCDDGTLWRQRVNSGGDGEWEKMRGVPQPEKNCRAHALMPPENDPPEVIEQVKV